MSQCEIVSKVVHFKIRCPACEAEVEIEEVFINTTTNVEDCCTHCEVELKLRVHVDLDVEQRK